MFDLFNPYESFATMGLIYDENDLSYGEPKVVRWLRAWKQDKSFQPNLSLKLVEGGFSEYQYKDAA